MLRLIHTEPLERVIARERQEVARLYQQAHAHVYLEKTGGLARTTHALSGELYVSNSGWVLLNVPNAIVRGAFDALNEPGAELPPNSSGRLNAHITVMSPDDVKKLGGVEKITERGHHFHYTLGPIQECVPEGWADMSKCWFIQVKSKELQDLRKSYGLSPTPKDGEHDFHITIAVRRKKVLQHNDVAKAAACVRTAAEKQALSPLAALGAGALATQVRSSPQAPITEPFDPIAAIDADTSHIDAIRALPVSITPPAPVVRPITPMVPPKKRSRRKKRITPKAVEELLKESEDQNALLEENDTEEDRRDEGEGRGRVEGRSPSGETRLPRTTQETDYDCAPASLKAIFDYYGVRDPGDDGNRIPDIRRELHCEPEGGTAPGDITREARDVGLRVDAKTPMSLEELQQHVSQGHPVIVAFQAHGTPSTYPDNKSGHYSVVIGMDDENIYFQDPSIEGTRGELPIDEFKRRWHDEDKYGKQYSRLGIAVWSEKPPQGVQDDATEAVKIASPADNQTSRSNVRVFIPGPDGRYLLQRAISDPTKFRVPGGGVEPGESLRGAAKRELLEELGHKVTGRSGLRFLGHDIRPEYANSAYFMLGKHNLQPGVYRASNDPDEIVDVDWAEPSGPNYWGPDLSVLQQLAEQQNKKRKKTATTRFLEYYDPEEIERRKKHKRMKELLTTMGLPLAGVGAGALYLGPKTNTEQPAQVTRFPGQVEPWVIRGRVAPGEKPSLIENTGKAYIAAGDDNYRAHLPVNNVTDLLKGIQGGMAQRPGKELGLLEVTGHGEPLGQVIGHHADLENLPPGGALNADTATQFAEGLKNVPHSPTSSIIGYGCHTGSLDTAKLPRGAAPENNFWQHIANKGNITALGSRGFTNTDLGHNLNTYIDDRERVTRQRREDYDPNYRLVARPGEERAWTKYQPNKPPEVVRDPKEYGVRGDSKLTFGALPTSKLWDTLYNAGRPASLLGSAAIPFMPSKKWGGRAALAASGLTLPMLLSESLARIAEIRGKHHLAGTTPGWGELAQGQGKVLPYAALTAMPLLTYGVSNLLGRWKDEQEKKEKKKL